MHIIGGINAYCQFFDAHQANCRAAHAIIRELQKQFGATPCHPSAQSLDAGNSWDNVVRIVEGRS
jgi:hypothetical protein